MSLQLRHKDEFRDLIAKYQPSDQTIELLASAKITLFDGPSGSGRNTIMRRLVQSGRYQQMLSDTTRPPRMNDGVLEKNGVEYWFKSEEEFLAGLKRGEYVEAAVIHNQQVSGVNVAEIKRAVEVGKVTVNDVQPDGIEAFRRHQPNTVTIFTIPPSFTIWMERLQLRGEMTPIERNRRLESAEEELKHALASDYYQFLINDDLDTAVQQVDEICQGKRSMLNDEKSRNIAQQMLIEVRRVLDDAAEGGRYEA